ncbi:MAG: 3-deoxy-7-phosphoheptulonate synthase [archaeon]
MIIVMRKGAKKKSVDHVLESITKVGLKPVPLFGTERTVIAVIGDERILHVESLCAMEDVEKAMPVLKPYKLVSRESHPKDTVIDVGGVKVGGKKVVVMAGPCAVESRKQIIETARGVKRAGATFLRGGAFKPRTGPYDFQGLGEKGLKYLAAARKETGLRIVTEVVDPRQVAMVAKYADVLQIGTRNMQNYLLLKEAGKSGKPVMLKRGMWATYKEFLLAAEYIMAEGNPNVILCERGIRTFETHTRNTLDLNAVASIKELSHLPVIVDPSHGTGRRSLVRPLSRAAIATGADGIIIESHIDPENALTDADQTISIEETKRLIVECRAIAKVVGRSL